jgi:hypothetical protein
MGVSVNVLRAGLARVESRVPTMAGTLGRMLTPLECAAMLRVTRNDRNPSHLGCSVLRRAVCRAGEFRLTHFTLDDGVLLRGTSGRALAHGVVLGQRLMVLGDGDPVRMPLIVNLLLDLNPGVPVSGALCLRI